MCHTLVKCNDIKWTADSTGNKEFSECSAWKKIPILTFARKLFVCVSMRSITIDGQNSFIHTRAHDGQAAEEIIQRKSFISRHTQFRVAQ